MYDIKNNRLITVTSILLSGSILISSCSVGKKHKRFEDGYEMPSDIPAQYSVYDDGLVPDDAPEIIERHKPHESRDGCQDASECDEMPVRTGVLIEDLHDVWFLFGFH